MRNPFRAFGGLAKDIWTSKKLIFALAWNDIKKRYAGSFAGILWAYIVPLVNILVMWFVFQYGFKSTAISESHGSVPFICWMVPGYIIWSFMNDTLIQSTGVLSEYSYLVKKVQFKTDILAPIKVVSSLFVHAFFLVFAVVIFCIFGFYPGWVWFQILYYLLGAILLMLGLAWLCSSIAVFLKDMPQIVTVILQIGFWATPIFWDLETIIGVENPSVKRQVFYVIFKCNPFYYLVNGYRMTMLEQVPFWAHNDAYWQIPYFWGFTILTLLLGAGVYLKTRKHYADVL